MTLFQSDFVSELSGIVFNLNEAWQQAFFWIFQKHSYENKVVCHSLCRTSRNYQRLRVVFFFSWTHSFHAGEKGTCLFILFVSWLPDLYPYLHIWIVSYSVGYCARQMLITTDSGASSEVLQYSQDWEMKHFSWNSNILSCLGRKITFCLFVCLCFWWAACVENQCHLWGTEGKETCQEIIAIYREQFRKR